MNDAERWLEKTGYIHFLERDTGTYQADPNWPAVNAYVRRKHLNLLIYVLQHDKKRFYPGPFHWLHRNVGTHLKEFRSYKGAIYPKDVDNRSIQIVVDRFTGKFYADLDRWNYQDLANAFAHLVVEVVMPHSWRQTRSEEHEPIIRAAIESVSRPGDSVSDGMDGNPGSDDGRTS